MVNYNRNNGSKKTFTPKTYAPKAATTGGDTKEGATQPRYKIALKVDGEEKLVPVTGVFENFDDTGAHRSNSVKIKTDITIPAGTTLFLFDNGVK